LGTVIPKNVQNAYRRQTPIDSRHADGLDTTINSRIPERMRIVPYSSVLCSVGILTAGSFLAGAQPVVDASGRLTAVADGATNWQQVLTAARSALPTNPVRALALCNRAVALAPTNAEPLLQRAAIRDSNRDYATAVRDASEAIRLDPMAADAWQLRGILNFKLSRFRESVADFDQFLALMPSERASHWQRGISLYYAGDFDAGRRQFELHATVNPNDVENAAWHFLCLARDKGLERARSSLLTPGPDARVPMREILALIAGEAGAEQVLAAANKRPTSGDALFYAHLYLGLYYDVLTDKARASEHIGKAVAIAPNHYMGDVARVHARLLQDRK
jgi:lipoprotein NlpI